MGETRHSDKSPDAFRTISEVADELELPQHVLRFWETRFTQVKPVKRAGGRRFYRPDDVDLLRGIRHLLYSEGYTIKGVQKIIKDNGVRHVQMIGNDVDGAPYNAEPEPAAEPRSRGEGLTGLLGLLPRRRGRPAEAEDIQREPSFGQEDLPRREPSLDHAPLYEQPAPPDWPDEPVSPRDLPRQEVSRHEAVRQEPPHRSPAREPSPRPASHPHAAPASPPPGHSAQRPLFDAYPIAPPQEEHGDDSAAYDDYGDDYGEPDMFDPAPPHQEWSGESPEPDPQSRAEMRMTPDASGRPPPPPEAPAVSSAAARPAPAVQPLRRPSRGPASRVSLPPSPELEDPLLPFFDDDPAEPPPLSEPLEARIRRLREQAPPATDQAPGALPPGGPPFGAPGYMPPPAAPGPASHPETPYYGAPAPPYPAPGMPVGGPGGQPGSYPPGHGAHAPPPYPPAPSAPGYAPSEGQVPHGAPVAAPPSPQTPYPGALHPGAPSPGSFGPPYGHELGGYETRGGTQHAPPEEYIPHRARRQPAGEPPAATAPEERVGPLTGPMVEFEPEIDPAPAILRRRTDTAAAEAAQEHEAPPPKAYNQEKNESGEASSSSAAGPYLPPHMRVDSRGPAGPTPTPVLSRDDIHRLQAALYELGECRRVLSDALARVTTDSERS